MSSTRERAIEHLRTFEERHLPSALRRLAQWKGFDARRDPDLVDDVRQELAIDCLSDPDAIIAASEDARTRRWFRLVHLVHYRLRTRDARCAAQIDEIDGFAIQLDDPVQQVRLDATNHAQVAELAERAIHLRNGRLNVCATARALGLRRRRFRVVWQELAAELGFGTEFLEFWQRGCSKHCSPTPATYYERVAPSRSTGNAIERAPTRPGRARASSGFAPC